MVSCSDGPIVGRKHDRLALGLMLVIRLIIVLRMSMNGGESESEML